MSQKSPPPLALSILLKSQQKNTVCFLSHYFDAQKVPFPIRGQSAQVAKFTAREMTSALADNKPVSARYESAQNLVVHGIMQGNYAAVCILSDKVAPSRAYRCLREILRDCFEAQYHSDVDCEVANAEGYIALFTQEDKLEELQSELEETKKIVYENLETIIDRGNKLDDIYANAVDLNEDAVQFLKVSKKLRCRCFGM